MNQPLVKKFLPLRGFKPKGVEVVIWATSDDLNVGTGDSGNDISFEMSKSKKRDKKFAKATGCHQPNLFDSSALSIKTRGKTNIISSLHFTIEYWGLEVITHELMHLVFWMIEYLGIEALCSMPLQEKWCYALGELSDEIAYLLRDQEQIYKTASP